MGQKILQTFFFYINYRMIHKLPLKMNSRAVIPTLCLCELVGSKSLCLFLKYPDKLGLWVKTPFLILFFDSQLHFLLYSMRVIVVFNATSFVCRIALLRLFTVVILTSQSWACFPVGFCLFACSWFPFICLVQTSYCPLAQAGVHLAISLPSLPGSWSDIL